jgi:hypothetical protein
MDDRKAGYSFDTAGCLILPGLPTDPEKHKVYGHY